MVATALLWADMDVKDAVEALYTKGHTEKKLSPHTINGWIRGDLKNPSINLTEALSDITGQPREVFLGQMNFQFPHLVDKANNPFKRRDSSPALMQPVNTNLKSVNRKGCAGSNPAPGTLTANATACDPLLLDRPKHLFNYNTLNTNLCPT